MYKRCSYWFFIFTRSTNNTLAFLLLFGSTYFFACSTGPEFNRDNKNDPNSEIFVPDTPSSPSQNEAIYIDSLRHLHLSWANTPFTDGVEIWRQYSPQSQVKLIGELSSSDSTFTDTTKIFTQGTIYEVRNYRLSQDSTRLHSDSPLSFTINLSPLTNISIGTILGYNITFNTQILESPNTLNFYDGIDIEINKNSNGSDWIYVTTIPFLENQQSFLYASREFSVYDLQLRLTQFVLDSSGTKHPLYTKEIRQYINNINDVEINFQDELTPTINFSSPFLLRDGVISKIGSRSDTLYTSKNNFTLKYTTQYSHPIKVEITPFIGTNYGKPASSGYKSPILPTPTFTTITPVYEHSFQLNWKLDSESQYAGIIVEQSTDNGNSYTPIDTLATLEGGHLVTNANPELTYSFRIHSYLSEWSNSILVDKRRSFREIESSELRFKGRKIIYSKNKKYVTKLIDNEATSWEDGVFVIQETETGTTYFHEAPVYSNSHRPTVLDFEVSEATNTLIYSGDNHSIDNSGGYISSFNFMDNTYHLEYDRQPSNVYDIKLGANDSLLYYQNYTSGEPEFVAYSFLSDTQIDASLRLVPPVSGGRWINAASIDKAIYCTNQGIYLYSLITKQIIHSNNSQCLNGLFQLHSGTLLYYSASDVLLFDLTTFTTTVVPTDLDFNALTELNSYWYFPEDDLFIYFTGYPNRNYRMYSQARDIDSYFTLPSFAENDRAFIRYIERNSDGTYHIITEDGDFTYSLESNWSLILTN